MRFFLIISFFAIANIGKAQNSLSSQIITEQEIEFPVKDAAAIPKEDVFPFCGLSFEASVDFEKWYSYLKVSLVLDDALIDSISPGNYTVLIQFAIGENGKLSNALLLKDPGYGLGAKVKNSISNCVGIWKPKIDFKGNIKPATRRQSITFIIEDRCEDLPEAVML